MKHGTVFIYTQAAHDAVNAAPCNLHLCIFSEFVAYDVHLEHNCTNGLLKLVILITYKPTVGNKTEALWPRCDL